METLIRIYSQDIGMELDIEKCVMFIIKSGKRETMDGKELPNQERIRTLRKKEYCEYLEILEVDKINFKKWKKK